MIQKGRKVQTKNKPNVSWRRLLPIILTCILAVSVMTISVRAIQQHNQKVREKQAQLTRLNATADDLKKVYDELVATIPNIREKSFTKTCGQSSDVLNNGTITCGNSLHLVFDRTSFGQYGSQNQIALKFALEQGFTTMGSLSVIPNFRDSELQSQKIFSKNNVACSIDGEYFTDVAKFRAQYKNSTGEYTGGINSLAVYCKEVTSMFIPGYETQD